MHTRSKLGVRGNLILALGLAAMGQLSDAFATTRYVNPNSASPSAPYTDWSSAATNIQDAIDAASPGDLVLVTNGLYQTGGRVAVGTLTNRVAVTKPVKVQSVNGPAVTTIQGYQVPVDTNGPSAIRCVYMTNGASLYGFTLANGATLDSSGTAADLAGAGLWCESPSAVASNCIISGNACPSYSDGFTGGGAANGTLIRCLLIGNRAGSGGGAFGCSLKNCVLRQNGAPYGGGGAASSILVNCTLAGNLSLLRGSGSCRVAGAYNCTLLNSIVYSNYDCNSDPGSDCEACNLFYSCVPPGNGSDYLTDAPLFVDLAGGDLRLQSNSPCINFGNNTYVAQSSDLDGNPRIAGGVVDIGAYEFQSPPASLPPVTHYVSLSSTNPLPPFTNWATAAANIQDAVDAAAAGDRVVVSNGVYQTGGVAVYGSMTNRVAVTKRLRVESVNGPAVTVIQGYQVPSTISGDNAIRCVYLAKGGTLSGFTLTNGATRAAGDGIQEQSGGGVWCQTIGIVSNCVIAGNFAAYEAGGVYQAALDHCMLTANRAASSVGGAYSGTIYNSVVSSNGAFWNTGGAYQAALNNCTVVGNWTYSAPPSTPSKLNIFPGGGIYGGSAVNCILYYNYANDGANYYQATVFSCCTTPDPGMGGNMTNEPIFIAQSGANLRLQANSPCINAGDNSSVSAATDLDGRPRIFGGRVDIGAYEFQAPLHYVSGSGTSPAAPYSSWATAATNIQNAVDAATGGDTVLVSNGTYSGSVSVTNPLTVLSVNGPRFTIIDGAGSVRCVSLTNSASLAGFTLTNGTDNVGGGGGGVWCASTNAVVTNCLITGNSAFGGGGAAGGTLYFCTLTGNSGVYGGGAAGCNLNNCTLVGNGASYGGGAHASGLNNCLVVSNTVNATGAGAFDSTLINCTVWGNTALDGTGGIQGCVAQNSIIFANDPWNQSLCSVDYCCSSPLADGFGNISDDPALVEPSAGDFHLQTNSPCINSGYNAFVTGAADLDGNRRIIRGTADIGAYEYQGAGSVISYAWLQRYGLPTDGSADQTDPDADGMNNWQEWIAGTVPTNSASLLTMYSPSNNAPGLKVSWQSVSGKTYFLLRATNLASQPAFSAVQSNIAGEDGITTYSDATATNPGAYFYRVGVQ